MKSVPSSEEEKPRFSESSWYHALTLTERIASLRNASPGAVSPQEDQLLRATGRLEQWKQQQAFQQTELFADRLAMDGITEQELLLLLAEPIEDLHKRGMEREQPAWVSELQSLWETSSHGDAAIPPSEAEPNTATLATDLLTVFTLLIEPASRRLRQGIAHLRDAFPDLPFDPATVHHLFLPNLGPHLQQVVLRVFILEMHIARLQGHLTGDTPEARFRDFLSQTSHPSHLYAFLREYPLLARIAPTIIQHWADYSLEIVQHLSEDWSEIRRVFARETEQLVEVKVGAGDTHRSGRSVAILRFRSGFKLVYKPRSLSLDQHFQDVLTWINTRGIQHPLRPLTIVQGDHHGWVEFVQTETCATEAEIKRFYERQGSYLALLYALDATDFHHENLLAAGEHPILVDLEALFQSRVGEYDPEKAGSAAQSIGYSVLRTGLLPYRLSIQEGEMGLDISGLGSKEGQMIPWAIPTWHERGTDQMRLKHERREMPVSENRPKLLGQPVEVTDYLSDILRGFTEVYQLLVAHQGEWLNDILPRFKTDEVRVVLRATQHYGILLSESYHPERLRDALERERLFDHLWDEVPRLPYLRQVLAFERQDLLQGDIPFFTTQPGSKDIFTSHGERIADFCSVPGIDCARRRIKDMSESDLALQQWIIRASLGSTLMGDARMPRVPVPACTPSAVTREQLIEAASTVGTRLEALAIRGEHSVNWLGIDVVTETKSGAVWQLQPSNLTLYGGLAGMILFLSYLEQLTGEQRYRDLADLALLSLDEQIESYQTRKIAQGIGAFTGLGSLIYLFAHLGVLRGEKTLLDRAHALVEEVEPLIEKDQQFDIIAGAAGCLLCLLAFYDVHPSPRTLEVALRCGEHLLAHAHELEGGLGWYTIKREEKAPAGFSHGAAGIALSLFQLAEVSQQERFRQAALSALIYEQSLFSAQEGNWARFRENGEPGYPISWCHGAPGVGLARLVSLRFHDDAQIRQEIQVALETTLAKAFGHNQSLCHGDLGNLETVLTASQLLGAPEYQEALGRLTAQIYSGIQESGWVTGVPLGVETPGLMTGLAGIGYQLLRLADPQRVPSVLVLAPPVGAF